MKYDISGAAEIILKAIKDLKIELNKLNEIISAREIEFKKLNKSKMESLRTLIIARNHCALIGVRFYLNGGTV
ncbi:hypothetical protein [Bacillus velezensis]|uniref:hypothetical protein n=1 Tax=Bacillus velezensis TaxID=492670 RepID=UPI0018E765DA|nr:hypothetical protein [Bacillus velezensis]